MPSVRRLLVLAGVIALAGGASACDESVSANTGAWVEVSPSSTVPGDKVTVRASCETTATNATIVSSAFGSVAPKPKANILTATVQVSLDAAPGTHEVTLTCGTGTTATTTLFISTRADRVSKKPTKGPHTGGGYLARGGGNEGTSGPWIWFAASGGAFAAATTLTLRRRRRASARASRPASPAPRPLDPRSAKQPTWRP